MNVFGLKTFNRGVGGADALIEKEPALEGDRQWGHPTKQFQFLRSQQDWLLPQKTLP